MSIRAEIQTTPYEPPLPVYVLKLSPTHVTLRCACASTVPETIASGVQVQLKLSSSAGSYLVALYVQSVQEAIVVASIASMARINRRKAPRVNCSWPVILRSVHPDGTRGAWKPATVTDVSEGGVGVYMEAQFLSVLWELRLEIQAGTAIRMYDDAGFNGNGAVPEMIMQVKTSLRHSSPVSDGVRLGLAFQFLTPQETRLVMDLLATIREKNGVS